MALDRRTREQMLAHCGELREDDGVDPRELFKSEIKSNRESRKAQQLCRQVAETLQQALGELGDALLQALSVVNVVPAPDASRLLVTVEYDGPIEPWSGEVVAQRLAACQGRLRTEVAAAITRRKTPALVFAVQVARRPSASERGEEDGR